MSEGKIYRNLVSFPVITILNFYGLKSTLPRSAPQILPGAGRAGQSLFFAGWGGGAPFPRGTKRASLKYLPCSQFREFNFNLFWLDKKLSGNPNNWQYLAIFMPNGNLKEHSFFLFLFQNTTIFSNTLGKF